MREHYMVKFTWRSASHFIIWYTNSDDGVIIDDRKPVVFSNTNDCRQFAHQSGIAILEESSNRYDFDSISNWVSSPQLDLIEPQHFLDAWNLVDDIVSSLHNDINYDAVKDEERNLYDKLFWANNLPTITPDDSEYVPIWTSEEINALVHSLSRGLKIIESITPN
jgi:hypothetical protein